jgi:serine/threonine protein kinase
MTLAASCLDHDSLKSLLENGAGPNELERLAGHLETCARCGETVDGLLASDSTAAALRGAKVKADEPSVQLLRDRLAKLRPAAASHETTAGENTQSVGSQPSIEATQANSVSLAPPQLPDEIGRLGGYRILAELGRGGMGVVYKAEDLKLKRLVALKVMAPSLAADPAARQRFLREAVAMAAVHHDNIVVIHAVDEDNGVPFLAMEFLQGMPLDKWLKGGRKATPSQVLRLGREIAEGLAAAHERGLIHRDIKPGNIWLDSAHKGRVKILDFGLARTGTEDVHLTQSGAIVGTPAYMSPEQARSEKVDGRSDLFSLGCVLYRLCTGVMPFAGDTTMSLLMSLALDHPKPVRELNSDVPAALSDLVARLLAKKPEDRPQSAREVVQAILAINRASASISSSEGQSVGIISAVRTKSAGINPAARTTAIAALPSPAPSSGGKKRRTWVLTAVAAGFMATAIVAAIVIIIRDKNGDKVAEITLSPGSTLTISEGTKKDDAVVATKSTVEDAWIKQVAAMPAEEQAEAVAAKLKELNPGFDGKITPMTEAGVVTGLQFLADDVTDISPVRALAGL